MKKPFRKSAAILSSGLLALTLAACGADDTTSPEGVTEEPQEDQFDAFDDEAGEPDQSGTPLDEDGATGSTEGATTSEETQVDIGETIEDPETGDTVEIVSAVRNFESEEERELIEEGGEVVLVEITITPGDDQGGRITPDNFSISWDDGQNYEDDDTDDLEDEMSQANREPLREDDAREQSGWLAFLVEEQTDTYQVQYARSADDATDGFTEQVEIPAP